MLELNQAPHLCYFVKASQQFYKIGVSIILDYTEEVTEAQRDYRICPRSQKVSEPGFRPSSVLPKLRCACNYYPLDITNM